MGCRTPRRSDGDELGWVEQDGGRIGARGTGKGQESLVSGWVVLPLEARVPRVASSVSPLARAIYPATCTGGRSAPPLNPPGWGAEHPWPPLVLEGCSWLMGILC